MTDVMAHASLVNKHRQSKESSSYNFWQDIFAYGEKMPNYHIGRLTMDCILAERFQKFVHIENFVNSVYKGNLLTDKPVETKLEHVKKSQKRSNL